MSTVATYLPSLSALPYQYQKVLCDCPLSIPSGKEVLSDRQTGPTKPMLNTIMEDTVEVPPPGGNGIFIPPCVE